ncbi:MAG: FAD-binding oxidoreductase [bacterium]
MTHDTGERDYDVIVVGAGSVGLPTAVALGESGLKTLVIDRLPAAGQGEHSHAIGGVRAFHAHPAKIVACRRAIETLSTWKERHGDDLEWAAGGYTFPVYREEDRDLVRGALEMQRNHGLEVVWLGPGGITEVVPGIRTEGLLGGAHSPEDGVASPPLVAEAFHRRAVELGVEFHFNESVTRLRLVGDRVEGVETGRDSYRASVVIDAAGPHSHALAVTAGLYLDVVPASHEAGVTEPVQPFFQTMLVDLRPGEAGRSFFFYQDPLGRLVFCTNPDPPVEGRRRRETGVFLPHVLDRMKDLIPRLVTLNVQQVWWGLFPMTPDGAPLVGWAEEVEGLVLATGMCGQGFMLGPGIAETVARLITDRLEEEDRVILEGFDPARSFTGSEDLA